ncbi:MAG TPA: [protein-PII] uridylyltransferase, partial [Gammaproteobacteria bacterium]|nr:[protein-PII] uridylyltransferase [Gammaproteobacteria bacterium]
MNLIPQTLLDGFIGDGPLIPRFKNVLREFSECQSQLFAENCPIEQLVQSRARLIDYLLKLAWSEFIKPAPDTIALVAVGGYGRGELHPASDIDLMVLLAEPEDKSHDENIQSLLTFLWDIGLDIGHSVRSVQDCATEAVKDITVQTNLIEARLLCGPEQLFDQMKQVTGPDKFWPSDQFFQAKWDEQKKRYHKYHDTAYNLEPNIKESPGGMRDIQVIGWVAKRHFQTATLYSLVEHRFLTQTEYRTLMEGQNLLWRIRFALHTLTGRREDRLLFDHQLALALQFGYQDGDNNLAIEQFMQHYYRTVMELERLNEMLLQLFQDEILHHGQIGEPVIVNERFQVKNRFLEVTSDQVFAQQPTALLEMFLVMAGDPSLKGVRAGTIRLARSATHLINNAFRQSPKARQLFIELFRRPEGLTHELRRMNRYGILAAYLPVFANIVGRMQYDLFHVYTVDEHTLFVVRNMRRFTVPEFSNEFPLCSSLIHTLPKPELLYIAGLFHDIAKGRGGDHSILGAKDAHDFCIDHGISEDDAQLVVWLVRSHLIMSVTAQRRDISDPEV